MTVTKEGVWLPQLPSVLSLLIANPWAHVHSVLAEWSSVPTWSTVPTWSSVPTWSTVPTWRTVPTWSSVPTATGKNWVVQEDLQRRMKPKTA